MQMENEFEGITSKENYTQFSHAIMRASLVTEFSK